MNLHEETLEPQELEQSRQLLNRKRLLLVTAHPDDETLGFGGTLAHYAAMGIDTHLICATRGQRGWFGEAKKFPGHDVLGSLRSEELMQAAKILNLNSVTLLDYMDGDLDKTKPQPLIEQIMEQIQRIRPQVVLTFDPYGIYGHPDHIAISQITTDAIYRASTRAKGGDNPSHRVDALYYRVMTPPEMTAYQAAFGELVMNVDGVERKAAPWEEWAVTHQLDTAFYVPQVWEAVQAHRTQLPAYERLMSLPLEKQRNIFGKQNFYRVFGSVDSGRQVASELL